MGAGFDSPSEERLTRSSWMLQKQAAYLDWRPVLPLQQALEWIVEWYRAYQGGADLQRLTLKQIERYEALTGN